MSKEELARQRAERDACRAAIQARLDRFMERPVTHEPFQLR